MEVDYVAAALYGFSTGVGVVLATKLVNWLDKHPFTVYFKQRFTEMKLIKDIRREAKRRIRATHGKKRK